MENWQNVFTGETDKNGININYGSRLKFPDGRTGYLLFDTGQLSAYFSDDNKHWLGLFGVNNWRSFNLRDCEVI